MGISLYLILMSLHLRLTEWFGLKGTFEDHLVPAISRDTTY